MLRTVLVPLDGSQLAESVLPYARNIGKRSSATLVLARTDALAVEGLDAALSEIAETTLPAGAAAGR